MKNAAKLINHPQKSLYRPSKYSGKGVLKHDFQPFSTKTTNKFIFERTILLCVNINKDIYDFLFVFYINLNI